jgi:hypothetical protein
VVTLAASIKYLWVVITHDWTSIEVRLYFTISLEIFTSLWSDLFSTLEKKSCKWHIVFFLPCFLWNRSPYCLFSPLPPLSGQPTAKSTAGWGDCWIRTQYCSFTFWCRYQWTTTAPVMKYFLEKRTVFCFKNFSRKKMCLLYYKGLDLHHIPGVLHLGGAGCLVPLQGDRHRASWLHK